LLGLELRLRLGREVRLDPLGPAPAPAPAARGLGLLRRTGTVPSRRLGIDDDASTPPAARSALAATGSTRGTRAVAPLAAGGRTRLGVWPPGQRPTVPAAWAGPRAAIATGAAGTRTAGALPALAWSARARAAVATGSARAATARPIALALAATRPALLAAFLWWWGVLKNPRPAPRGTGPPDLLAGRRLGRGRDLPLWPATCVGWPAVGRLLRASARCLLPSSTPAPLRPAAGGLLPSGARGLLTARARSAFGLRTRATLSRRGRWC
jgi:hypothetical protein